MFDGGKISKTNDGGNTWTDQFEGRFWDMDMINIDTGYALTWDGKIYKTINGGIPVGVTESNIDGFRCDMAGMVPVDFWNKAKEAL